nr:hypothetical protein CFP56_21809 [Quercus suber]
MPRSPSEATRFTATGPYVSTKPQTATTPTSFSSNPATSFSGNTPSSSAGSQLNIGAAAPRGETPQQKIARLRAAAQATKRGQESAGDKVIRIGRVWADRAHRVTAIGLIGLTVVSGAVATAGITDMLIHNRRRRNEWLAEQKAKHAYQLAEARDAQARGSASEDQILLLNRERAADEAAEAKRSRPGMIKNTTNWLFGGLEKEETRGGRLGAAAAPAATTDESVPALLPFSPSEEATPDAYNAVEEKIDEQRRQSERKLGTIGGPLDQQAQLLLNNASSASKSWLDWLGARR